jgi:hypothetical protein
MDFVALFLVVFIILQAADVWLTVEILKRGGRELNPFMRRAMEIIGLMPGMAVLKGIGTGLIVGIVAAFGWRWELMLLACAMQAGVVAWNVRVLRQLGGE